jgi:hypothetical protein
MIGRRPGERQREARKDRTLREPEREWLAQVLRAWAGRAEPLPEPDAADTQAELVAPPPL